MRANALLAGRRLPSARCISGHRPTTSTAGA